VYGSDGEEQALCDVIEGWLGHCVELAKIVASGKEVRNRRVFECIMNYECGEMEQKC
jgi:hypothetical protein